MQTSTEEKALTKEQQNDVRPIIQFSSISLFPEMFEAISDYGVVGRAVKANRIGLDCINPRDFTKDRHRTVDDRPYGGGPGMLMKVEPLQLAIQAAKENHSDLIGPDVSSADISSKAKVIYLSPQGEKLDHSLVRQLSQEQHLILLSGRYEGVDQRLIDKQVDMEVSLGDFGASPIVVSLGVALFQAYSVREVIDSAVEITPFPFCESPVFVSRRVALFQAYGVCVVLDSAVEVSLARFGDSPVIVSLSVLFRPIGERTRLVVVFH